MQTDQFDTDTCTWFTATTFRGGARGNRMGVQMTHGGAPFVASDQLTILSDVIVPGDIQIASDDAPFVLMCECQTTGGYPRVGTAVPNNMARVARAPAEADLLFELVELEHTRAIEQRGPCWPARKHDTAVARSAKYPRLTVIPIDQWRNFCHAQPVHRKG